MKNYYILFFFLVASSSLVAQEVMTIAATVLDEKTKEPVSFVNIGFVDKGVGTVTNENGNFSLSWKSKEIKGANILQISSIGYETKNIPLVALERLNSFDAVIYLSQTAYVLDEVVIVNEKREFDKLGSFTYSKENIGYWLNKEGLGGEIATHIKVDKKNTKLHNLTFNIIENQTDSLLVRVKVYDYHRGFPGKNLVTKNIFHTITKKEGVENIPLKKYNIIASEDIIVSLELVKVYGSSIYFSLSSTPYGGHSYSKELSLDVWKPIRNVGLGFGMLCSYPSKSAEKIIPPRGTPKNIDLYWDASLLSKSRNIEEELTLLTKYFNYVGDVSVRVVKFSHGISAEEIFSIKNGRSKDLEAYLENTFYNGALDFSEVLKATPTKADIALVFTNGLTVLEPLKPLVNIPVFCINSVPKAAHGNLQEVSYVSGGHYINLAKEQVKNALVYLKNDVKDVSSYSKNQKADKSGYLHGVVHNEKGVPLQGAFVQIKNTFYQVETGLNGGYAIDAKDGDILTINAFGMYTKDTVVGQLKAIRISLKANRELLDEVYLESKSISDLISEEIVSTPFGKKKRGAVGFSLNNKFTSEDIRPQDVNLDMILQRMPGVILANNSGMLGVPKKYIFRRTFNNSFLNKGDTYPVVIIDEMLFDQNSNQNIPPINTQTISSIILLKTKQSTVRYGQLAAYGAIVIKTKLYEDSEIQQKASPTDVEKPSTLGYDNEYNEQVFTLEMAKSTAQPYRYIQDLNKATTEEDAKQMYQKLQKRYGSTIPFYLETSAYFEKWDALFAAAVRSNIVALAPENVKALKALAFAYEAKGANTEAKHLYEHIINVAPKDVQSYMDVARMSAAMGEIETAEALYTQLFYNTIPNVNTLEAQEQIVNEFRKLAANYKSQLDFKELPKKFLEVGFKQDVRIVFDWNDSMAEFELQFVSPENKYFKFSHTIFENRSLMEQEVKDGYMSKEFVLDNATSGRWLINVNHLGEPEEKNPSYLKYTLYRNYGLPNETREVKVINLSEYQEKVTLDTFML
jgi:hypothetical protein